MPRKTDSKGPNPENRILDRTQISTEVRFAMIALHEAGVNNSEIGRKYKRPAATVSRLISRAKRRAEEHKRPLADLANVLNTPAKRTRRSKGPETTPAAATPEAFIAPFEARPDLFMFPLIGHHIVLHPLTSAQIPPLYDALCGFENADLWQFLADGPYNDIDSFAAWVEKILLEPHCFVYTLFRPTQPDRALGIISLDITPTHHRAELGQLFSKSLQRTTAATEAFFLASRHIFALGYARLEWKCDTTNEASCRAAQRLGYRRDGVMRKHMVVKGRRRDTVLYSILDEGWEFVDRALEAWLGMDNFDEQGRQRKRLEDIRREVSEIGRRNSTLPNALAMGSQMS